MHKTSAWPLAWVYAALVVFASLFPFTGWRDQGISPLVFLAAALPPPYWTGFDVVTNIVGYAPLGFLLALALLRTGRGALAVPLAPMAIWIRLEAAATTPLGPARVVALA